MRRDDVDIGRLQFAVFKFATLKPKIGSVYILTPTSKLAYIRMSEAE
jgi:hypothetical protein